MKHLNFLMILAFGILLMSSCSNQIKKENEALKAEIAMLAEQNAELAMGNIEMEFSLESYHALLKEIDQQLAAVDEKHELVKGKSAELKNDKQVAEGILLHIEHLQHQMENNKHKIAHVNKNMEALRKQNADQHEELHMMDLYINNLVNLVVRQDSELVMLHDALMAQGLEMGALSEAYEDQAMYNEVLINILNTGFYIAGTKQELKELGIIDMEGGFIGIGRVKTLNANAPVEFLTYIDIREADMFEFPGKKAELITAHSSDSYELTFDKKNELVFLGIANKLKFWQETNYLVVEIVN
jgi:hypothetical protein